MIRTTFPVGVKEKDLRLYRYVPETGWVELTPQGVNTAGKYVWTEASGFSTFGLFGTVTPTTPDTTLPLTMGYLSHLVLLGILLAAGGLFFIMKRRNHGAGKLY